MVLLYECSLTVGRLWKCYHSRLTPDISKITTIPLNMKPTTEQQENREQ